jgi:hypothetical protein
MRRPLVIYDFATTSLMDFLIYEANFVFFFYHYTNLSLSAPILKESLHLVEAVGLLLEVLEEAQQLLRHSEAGIIALSLAILLRRLSPVEKI